MTYATIARHSHSPLRGDLFVLLAVPAVFLLAAFAVTSSFFRDDPLPARPRLPVASSWMGGLAIGLEAVPMTGARSLHNGASHAASLISRMDAGLVVRAAALAARMRSAPLPDRRAATAGLIAHARLLAARIRAGERYARPVAPSSHADASADPPASPAPALDLPPARLPTRPADTWLLRAWAGKAPPAQLAAYDASTAVYAIASHTVYLPDGTQLEAHSGLGSRLDNPTSVKERMRGATPPNVYEIQPLDKLFHRVRALRLNPIGGGNMYGRDGMLAHTYMLGPRGESNGCVVFKDYAAFLAAWDRGAIKRLAVLARLD